MGSLWQSFQKYRREKQMPPDLDEVLSKCIFQVKRESQAANINSEVLASTKERALSLSCLDGEIRLVSSILQSILAGVPEDKQEIICEELFDLTGIRKDNSYELQVLREKYFKTLNKIYRTNQKLQAEVHKLSGETEISKFIKKIYRKYVSGYFPDSSYVQEILKEVKIMLAQGKLNTNEVYELYEVIQWLSQAYALPKKETAYPLLRAYEGSDVFHIPQGCTHYPGVEQITGIGTRVLFLSRISENSTFDKADNILALYSDNKNIRLCSTCFKSLKKDRRQSIEEVIKKYISEDQNI
jgi:hypothetical protein